MNYSLRTKHITLSDFDRKQLDRKLSSLAKHLKPPFTTDIFIEHDRHHHTGQVIAFTINIKQGKKVFHAERQSESLQDALDLVLAALKRELKKEHDKKKRHGGGVEA